MKKLTGFLLGMVCLFSCSHEPSWQLVWEENFDGTELDTTGNWYGKRTLMVQS